MLQIINEDVSRSSAIGSVLTRESTEMARPAPQSLPGGRDGISYRGCSRQTAFCKYCPRRGRLVVVRSFAQVYKEDAGVRSTDESIREWIRKLETLWSADRATSEEAWITSYGSNELDILVLAPSKHHQARLSFFELCPTWITISEEKRPKNGNYSGEFGIFASDTSPEKETPSLKTDFLKTTLKYAKEGDKAAFEVLYWRYTKPIWHRLMGLVGKKEIAEELHQETFLRAWTHLPHLEDNVPFERWLYKIAAHIAIDHLRHAKHLAFVTLPEEESAQRASETCFSMRSPEDSICNTAYLEFTLSQVSPQFRMCLLLQDHWGFSQREIAALLNITVGCVGSYISRGREQFRQAYWRLRKEEEAI